MKTISLRKFRDSIGDLEEEVAVARRDPDGNIMVIGRWVPSLTYPPDAVPLAPRRRRIINDNDGPLAQFNTRPFTPVPKK